MLLAGISAWYVAARRLAASRWACWRSAGQWCMTRAYSHGATLVVASLQYSGIVFGALYSVCCSATRSRCPVWAGMALIVASGIAATVLRSRAAPDAPAEEH